MTTVVVGDDGQAAGADPSFAAGVATATAATAAEEASEAAETAEQAAETAQDALEAAAAASGSAYDAQADVAALRGTVESGFAAINDRLDTMTAAPVDIEDDGVPAPEKNEPDPEPAEPDKPEEGKPEDDKPARGYGSKSWFG